MPNLQLNRLKSEMKNGTEVTLKVSLNVAGDSNDEKTFLLKQLLTSTQVSKLHKSFTIGSSANISYQKLNCKM